MTTSHVATVIDYGFDIPRLLAEARIFKETYDKNLEQLCVTGKSPSSDYKEGSGGLVYEWNKMVRTRKAVISTEDEFVHFLDMFKGTYTEEVYNKLSETYKVGRLRFMYVKPKTCYTWHMDSTPRIHIPLYTDPKQCGLIIEDSIIRMPANGSAYIVDTTKYHTAFNAWLEWRIHLVGVLL